jgi:hypothetical protein
MENNEEETATQVFFLDTKTGMIAEGTFSHATFETAVDWRCDCNRARLFPYVHPEEVKCGKHRFTILTPYIEKPWMDTVTRNGEPRPQESTSKTYTPTSVMLLMTVLYPEYDRKTVRSAVEKHEQFFRKDNPP